MPFNLIIALAYPARPWDSQETLQFFHCPSYHCLYCYFSHYLTSSVEWPLNPSLQPRAVATFTHWEASAVRVLWEVAPVITTFQ